MHTEQQYAASINAAVPDVEFPETRVDDAALLLAASDALEAFLEMCVDERLIHSDACHCETCETQANGRRVQRLIDARLETTK